MKIFINESPLTLEAPSTITELLSVLDRHQPGTALAINHAIIPRTQWAEHQLQDGDHILLFQAIAGG